MDKGDRPDNWTDTSGSAMFTYTIQRGIEIGRLDRGEYAPVVEKGYKGITENAKINDKGLVDIYSALRRPWRPGELRPLHQLQKERQREGSRRGLPVGHGDCGTA